MNGFSVDYPSFETVGFISGIASSQRIHSLIQSGCILSANPIEERQVQPASLDLRLGEEAYRVKASFLSSPGESLSKKLKKHYLYSVDLSKKGTLQKGCVYIVPLKESLKLPFHLCAAANPKSSIGRVDVLVRVITDDGQSFDTIPPGYKGCLYLEVCPRTFSIQLQENLCLAQIRFFSLGAKRPCKSITLSVNLETEDTSGIVGYRARRNTFLDFPVDLTSLENDAREYWEPIRSNSSKSLVLQPEEFYILRSKEKVRIPDYQAAEMVAFDPTLGEFRAHYAGFFDPGFGGEEGTYAVLEVRPYGIPFLIEDGQDMAKLNFEYLIEPTEKQYGKEIGSNYADQGLRLSKYFKSL